MTATADAALINHLLDAAGAASYLWDAWVPSAARRHLESDLEPLAAIRGEPASTLATAVTTLAAGLHDIGKGSPVFQSNSEVHYSQLDPRLRIPPSKMLPPEATATNEGVCTGSRATALLAMLSFNARMVFLQKRVDHTVYGTQLPTPLRK